MFLRQSLLEMLDLFAIYTVHLGMDHTLLHFTIKEGTIWKYLNEAAKSSRPVDKCTKCKTQMHSLTGITH
jgi:hypothetical protein